MKLTLRTLLAWLDDTLPPAEVREIGHMVNDTPIAKELVERIHRVTRQRRLTVPGTNGPDGTDPNVVAAYLDNQLTPEQVAEFEKRCLTSDVHLAEVASVHQILSLIGQKAKVPAEARHRMYHLVRGREAVSAKAPRAFAPTPAEPAAAPVAPWVPEDIPRRSLLERFGPVAAVAALAVVLIWSASKLLKSGARDEGESTFALHSAGPKGRPPEAKASPDAEPAKGEPGANAPTPGGTGPNPAGSAAAAPAEPEPAAKEKEAEPEPAEKAKGDEPVAPPGAVGVAGQVDGLLLRHSPNDPKNKWERLSQDEPLRDGDRIVGLDPFRSAIALGPARLELVNEAEVRLDKPGNVAAHFELVRGRVALHAPNPAAPVVVEFGGSGVRVEAGAGMLVGLARQDHRAAGEFEVTSAPSLLIAASDGEVTLSAGGATARLVGPGSVEFQPPKHFAEAKTGVPPRWVAEASPSPVDQQLGKQFAAYFKGNKPLLTGLIEAQLDDQKELRQLAIEGLGGIGSLYQVVTALSTPIDPVSRRAAIRVLREHLARGPGATRELRATMEEVGGKEWAEKAEKLLVGFSPAEAKKESTYKALIDDLRNTEISVRELALDNLEALTGRDALGYDPSNPEGAGLKAWKDLLDRKELPPKGPADEK